MRAASKSPPVWPVIATRQILPRELEGLHRLAPQLVELVLPKATALLMPLRVIISTAPVLLRGLAGFEAGVLDRTCPFDQSVVDEQHAAGRVFAVIAVVTKRRPSEVAAVVPTVRSCHAAPFFSPHRAVGVSRLSIG